MTNRMDRCTLWGQQLICVNRCFLSVRATMNTQMVGYLPKKTSISNNVVSILGFPQSQSLYVVLYLFLYIFIVYIFIVNIYYPTVVPWSSLGNRKPQLQAGEDSESCCLPACARYSCGKGYVPNPQVALQGGLWGGLCGTSNSAVYEGSRDVNRWCTCTCGTKWYFLGMSWNNQSANVWKHVLFGLAQR